MDPLAPSGAVSGTPCETAPKTVSPFSTLPECAQAVGEIRPGSVHLLEMKQMLLLLLEKVKDDPALEKRVLAEIEQGKSDPLYSRLGELLQGERAQLKEKIEQIDAIENDWVMVDDVQDPMEMPPGYNTKSWLSYAWGTTYTLWRIGSLTCTLLPYALSGYALWQSPVFALIRLLVRIIGK